MRWRSRFLMASVLLSLLASFAAPLAAPGGAGCAMMRCGKSCCCAPSKGPDRCRLGLPCGPSDAAIPAAPHGIGRSTLLPGPAVSLPLLAEGTVDEETWRPPAVPGLDPPYHPPRPLS